MTQKNVTKTKPMIEKLSVREVKTKPTKLKLKNSLPK